MVVDSKHRSKWWRWWWAATIGVRGGEQRLCALRDQLVDEGLGVVERAEAGLHAVPVELLAVARVARRRAPAPLDVTTTPAA